MHRQLCVSLTGNLMLLLNQVQASGLGQEDTKLMDFRDTNAIPVTMRANSSLELVRPEKVAG